MTDLAASVSLRSGARVRPALDGEATLMRLLIGASGLWLIVFILLPLGQILYRSGVNRDGRFVGLANYLKYLTTPTLSVTLFNSLYLAVTSTLIAVALAFVFAYGLTRTRMPGKGFFRLVAMLPLYAPSLLHAIALIYLFGNKGFVTTGVFGFFAERWGVDLGLNIGLYTSPTGVILAEVLYLFPQAVLILTVALALADARLFEAALALRASPLRTFFTVTLPGVRYGLMSAAFVCFTLVFTDFGIPKVIGGNFAVMATDIYKKVIGQQDFVMGATVSVLLLTPAAIAFVADRFLQRQQVALLTTRATPYQPKPDPRVDWTFFALACLMSSAILAVLSTAFFASLIKVWPYDFTLGFSHYDFTKVGGGGLGAYWNSVRMSAYTAVFGALLTFCGAYLIEKGRGLVRSRAVLYLLSTLPAAVPGLVIGLAYIFFFNDPSWTLPLVGWQIPNPFNPLYGTMAILALSTIVHFYTVSFYAATAALKQIDAEFEAVAASLRVPFYRTFRKVTMPICLPAILEIGMYYFVNAMTTVSAVIFLYGPGLKLASVAVVNMDDAGDTAAAAAMSMLIFATSLGVRFLYELATRQLRQRSQAWLQR